MNKVTFTINKKHLAYQAWLKYFTELDSAPAEWRSLYNSLKEQYGKDIAFTFFDLQYVGWSLDTTAMGSEGELRVKNARLVNEIFEKIFSTGLFKDIHEKAEAYKQILEKEWEQYGQEALQQLKDISKLGIGDREIEVFVLNPETENGSYIEDNRIEWGFTEIYPKSNVIGICHEILHVYTAEQASNLMHALIFLAAQEELRCRLNNKTEYFNNDGVKTYHDHVVEEQHRLLPEWKKYLDDGDNTLIDLYERLSLTA